MKILLVGASGTLGSAIQNELKLKEDSYEVITAGRNSGDLRVDMSSIDSIKEMFEKLGSVDHVISAAGSAAMKPIEDLTNEDVLYSVQNKLLGQLNLVLIGQNYLNEKGSFTLTTGVIKDQPIKMGSMLSMTNGAVASFVKGAAIDFKKDIRINCVSPSVFDESMKDYGEYFIGVKPVPVKNAAKCFIESIEGDFNGHEFIVY
ncbi:short chain dehydrogenase [Spiroplasma monobiae]|uniref:Short chain dehydrogenase n=1 Tax=Spiroplasma monobiae MQ-1 TaxID=1336748 RepID=A0A2K9LY76_SPISQ|nr:short chain dehydrogenase [Spiroplasma monobiae]AUM62684.1 short chain dehydrogenase [Spiroplasma monobiae MQ-1]